MYSRFIFRSVQGVSSLSTFTRFLSLTQIQSTAATKLKENTSIGASSEKFAAKTECSSAKETSNVPSEEKTPIPPPTSSTQDPNKTYSEKIHRLVDEISKLSLVDVRDLNELLKKTLNIKDTPIVASGGMGSGAAPPLVSKNEEDDEDNVQPTAQSVFKVRLVKFDEAKKVPVIKQVKDVVENINLVQAKKLVESVPQVIRDNLSKADAETTKAKIEAAGGVCVVE